MRRFARLHLAGGSLREIAQSLGLSHQRVKQIVDGVGGSWWTSMWRTRKPSRDSVCTFCGSPPITQGTLVAGPDVNICDACINVAVHVMADASRSADHFVVTRERTNARCSFCRSRQSTWALPANAADGLKVVSKQRKARRPMLIGTDANICGGCVEFAREILDARTTAP